MTDNYDQYLDALTTESEAEEAPQKPQRASRKPRGASAARKSSAPTQAAPMARDEPRGKRAKEGYDQVNASVPAELKASAFFYLKMQREPGAPSSLSDLVEELLDEWVERQGGVIVPKRRKK